MNHVLVNALRRQLQTHIRRNFGLSAECRRGSKCKPESIQKCSPPPYKAPCPPLKDCKACRPISPNPCMPTCPVKEGSHVKYQLLAIFMMICAGFQATRVFKAHVGHEPELCCYDYEYMNMRTKRFPWGNGDLTLFHNDKVNCLPESVRDNY